MARADDMLFSVGTINVSLFVVLGHAIQLDRLFCGVEALGDMMPKVLNSW